MGRTRYTHKYICVRTYVHIRSSWRTRRVRHVCARYRSASASKLLTHVNALSTDQSNLSWILFGNDNNDVDDSCVPVSVQESTAPLADREIKHFRFIPSLFCAWERRMVLARSSESSTIKNRNRVPLEKYTDGPFIIDLMQPAIGLYEMRSTLFSD